jgi:hypothetical protein
VSWSASPRGSTRSRTSPRLYRAFAIAKKAAPSCAFSSRATGPEESRLRALADELGVTEKAALRAGSPTWTFTQNIHINALTSLSETFPYPSPRARGRNCRPVASPRVRRAYLIDDGRKRPALHAGDAEALAAIWCALRKTPRAARAARPPPPRKEREKFSIGRPRRRSSKFTATILRRRARAEGARRRSPLRPLRQKHMGDDANLMAILAEPARHRPGHAPACPLPGGPGRPA